MTDEALSRMLEKGYEFARLRPLQLPDACTAFSRSWDWTNYDSGNLALRSDKIAVFAVHPNTFFPDPEEHPGWQNLMGFAPTLTLRAGPFLQRVYTLSALDRIRYGQPVDSVLVDVSIGNVYLAPGSTIFDEGIFTVTTLEGPTEPQPLPTALKERLALLNLYEGSF